MSDADARQKAENYYAALDLMADGKLEDAVVAYRESLAVDPSFTECMHGLARALQDLQRYDEAIAVAQQITELDPDDVLAHTSLSVLYRRKGCSGSGSRRSQGTGSWVEAAVEEKLAVGLSPLGYRRGNVNECYG